jgi:hypothetical protein
MKITSDLTNLTTAILIVQMFFEWTLIVFSYSAIAYLVEFRQTFPNLNLNKNMQPKILPCSQSI